MIRYDRKTWVLAACFSALAGYIDAVGFLYLGGFFVSFMSGNSTRLGVGISHDLSDTATAAGLIFAFVLGVMLGSFTGRRFVRKRRTAILSLVAALLAFAAVMAMMRFPPLAAGAMAMAMGAENALFERDGEVSIGLTYMTGTLVKIGQRLTTALMGGERFGWVPYLLLWFGLVVGAITGGALFSSTGALAIWMATGGALLLAISSLREE